MAASTVVGVAAERAVRHDIQVLRAIAVGLVLAYHLWPGRLPGGFVGVDVFFVISGALITAHLLREAEDTGTIRVARFWAARARRLLPLAFVVLVATAAGAWLVAPASQLDAIMRHVVASTLYVENWLLASDSVDYLAADQQPLPTQHFWSLSVEEQCYVVLPLLLVAAAWAAVRIARARRLDDAARRATTRWIVAGLLAAIVIASLAASLVTTATDPGPAYVATTTRAWQFAAGGLLAWSLDAAGRAPVGRHALVGRTALSWAGVVLIGVAALAVTGETPYPDVAALLPVAGAACFLLGGDVGRWFAPSALSRIRPIVWLGDVSYGVYLWHWPLIVLLPGVVGDLTTPWRIAIVGMSLALAWASRLLVEDPFRFGAFWRARAWRGFALAGVGSLVVLAVAGSSLVALRSDRDESAVAAAEVRQSYERTAPDPDSPLVPSLAARPTDQGAMYDCFDFDLEAAGPTACTYGDDASPSIRIALVGDSHGAALVPGMTLAAEERGWQLTTYVGLLCDAPQQAECGGEAAIEAVVAGDFDVVVAVTARQSLTEESGLVAFWDRLLDARVPLMLVADLPTHSEDAFACLDASHGDPVAATACTTPLPVALDQDVDHATPYALAHGVPLVDLPALLCDDEGCASVVGNVVVYQDGYQSHVTATYSRLLAPLWVDEIEEMLADA